LTSGARVVIISYKIPAQLAETKIPQVGGCMVQFFRTVWTDEQGQDIAEYAVMLAVILVLVIGTVKLIGTSANNAFSQVASSLSS
jgi:Flp pilus assembly pilin Flp